MDWQSILGVRVTDKYPEGIKKRKTYTKSDEQVIKEITEMMQDPMMTRNRLCKGVKISIYRLEQLAKDGLVKIPPKVSKGRFHLYTKKTRQHPWR
ncbi:MAG: FEZ-like protein [Caudovirales sp. ctOwN3]|nr:MAG: FEZ-like protein [Caudovirales sp. ctOwN3]